MVRYSVLSFLQVHEYCAWVRATLNITAGAFLVKSLQHFYRYCIAPLDDRNQYIVLKNPLLACLHEIIAGVYD
jgi:hypothetical protein